MNEDKSLEDLLKDDPSNPTPAAPAGGSGDDPANKPPVNADPQPPAPKYKVGNRELEPDQLFEEYQRLQTDYTKKTQELSEAKKPTPQSETPASLTAADQALVNELTRLGFKRGGLTEEEFKTQLSAKETEIVQKSSGVATARIELKEALEQLENDFDGSVDPETKVPKPKVDKSKVLDFIVKNPSINLSPLEIAHSLYHDSFVKWEAGKMVGNQAAAPGLPATENGGSGHSDAPPTPSFNFQDNSVDRGLENLFGKK